ncbi:35886_t:CDS:2 [Gigaspora margarita]|uniref:35886_t:CDS:1 n=1 Tax=Gigaspora margarita TaxID=4874 RepID=A0ABN7V324_GIGMA|nr:35886_t:CDS:2 [Gigaspora margarita]
MQLSDTLPKEASCFPRCQAFDNAKSYMTYVPNALVAKNMNLSSARKEKKIGSTSYFCERIKYDQSIVFPLDYYIPELHKEAKELKQGLSKRGLWLEKGLKLKEAQELISQQPDFLAQKG